MSDIEWAEPPTDAKSGRSYGWIKRAVEQLKERPGEWAIVGRDQSAAAARHWKSYGVEATVRRDPDTGRYTIYARWPIGADQ